MKCCSKLFLIFVASISLTGDVHCDSSGRGGVFTTLGDISSGLNSLVRFGLRAKQIAIMSDISQKGEDPTETKSRETKSRETKSRKSEDRLAVLSFSVDIANFGDALGNCLSVGGVGKFQPSDGAELTRGIRLLNRTDKLSRPREFKGGKRVIRKLSPSQKIAWWCLSAGELLFSNVGTVYKYCFPGGKDVANCHFFRQLGSICRSMCELGLRNLDGGKISGSEWGLYGVEALLRAYGLYDWEGVKSKLGGSGGGYVKMSSKEAVDLLNEAAEKAGIGRRVNIHSSKDDIFKLRKFAAVRLHPDKSKFAKGTEEYKAANEYFAKVNEAVDVLVGE